MAKDEVISSLINNLLYRMEFYKAGLGLKYVNKEYDNIFKLYIVDEEYVLNNLPDKVVFNCSFIYTNVNNQQYIDQYQLVIDLDETNQPIEVLSGPFTKDIDLNDLN